MNSVLETVRQWLAAKPVFVRLLMAFLAGAVTVLAMPPWSFWPALFIGFPVFYILLGWTQSRMQAFWQGWFFGFGFFVFGLAWIARALTVEGSTYSWVIPIAIAGLPALLSMFTGLMALAARQLTDPGKVSGFFAFCGFMTLGEWLRGHVFTGFPWNLYGYGWAGVDAMAQTVATTGSYGLTLLTVFWAALPGFLIFSATRRHWKIVLALTAAASLVLCFSWGTLRLAQHPTSYDTRFVLRIVQPSIPQSMKWDAQKAIESFRQIVAASEPRDFHAPSNATVLMIWPETAVSQDILQHPIAQSELKVLFQKYPGAFTLATGLLRWEADKDKTRYYNSIGIFDRDMNLLETYDKSHLVPFGEYIPFSRWLPANPFVAMEGFESGNGPGTLGIPVDGGGMFLASPLICYEVIFPGAVVGEGTRPGLLLNVTNDGWYGDSAGPRQHLEIARFRAIEEGIPLARTANTGISAVIDPYGRIVWRSRIFEITASNVALPKKVETRTVYGTTGDWPVLLLIIIFCTAAGKRALTGLLKRKLNIIF